MVGRTLHFEWNEAKNLSNVQKHGVAFTLALTVFADPNIATMFDGSHSESEERWIAAGIGANGAVLVVVYTWTELGPMDVKVRIISAREATKSEIRVFYEEANERTR
jgi:uncharacterized DUF497 family protein